jgi:hypothetical protein
MKLAEINRTDKAKKKIAGIAKKNNLEYDFVYRLFSFHWNYDGVEGDWVINSDLDKDDEFRNRYEFIYDRLRLSDRIIKKDEVIETIYDCLIQADVQALKNNFLYGSLHGSYGLISEYSSYHYLNNATMEKLETLDWEPKSNYTRDAIVKNIFLKIFRGGGVDRRNLEYLYADLSVKLKYDIVDFAVNDWTIDFIKNLTAKTLTELVKELRVYCKGGKYFLQTILEALGYSGILKVPNHDISKYFIPDYREDKVPISNEWTYPLRCFNPPRIR